MEVPKRKSLRKRMRDLQRTITRTEDASVVKEKETRIEELRLMKKLVLKNTHLYGKYKAVRFFGSTHSERRKLERQLNKAQKAAESDPAQLAQIQADLSYVKNYPINYKYVSLFSTPTDLTLRYRDMMRRHIQKSLARKSQYREQMLEKEQKEEKETGAEDPFFTERTDLAAAPFATELRMEDVEEEAPSKRPRERSSGKSADAPAKRTHLRFDS